MAGPTPSGRSASQETSSTTTHTIDLPADLDELVGQRLLIAFVSLGGGGGPGLSTPDGYLVRSSGGLGGGSGVWAAIVEHVVAGDEGGSVQFTTSTSTVSSHRSIVGPFEEAMIFGPNTANSNTIIYPQAEMEEGDYLVIAVVGAQTGAAGMTISTPANYGEAFTQNTGNNGAAVGTFEREVLAATSEQPGNSTMNSAERSAAFTIVLASAEEPGGTIVTRTLSDSVSVTDDDDERRNRAREAVDQIFVADTVLRAASRLRVASDTLSISDVAARTVSKLRSTLDQLLASDSSGAFRARLRAVQSDLSVADSSSALRQSFRDVLDALSLDDFVSAIRVPDDDEGGVVNSRVLTDELTVEDLVAELRLRRRILSDAVSSVADELLTSSSRVRLVVDVLSATDSAIRALTAVRTMTSALAFSDQDVVTRRMVERVLQDEATLTDAVIAAYITEILNSLIVHGLETLHVVHGVATEQIDVDIVREIG